MSLTIGQPAPEFILPDQNGKQHSLVEYAGKWLIIYFYPKDDTPGCTVEACSFRDSYTTLMHHAAVIGVSPDSPESHAAFAAKYTLPFPLLADPKKTMIQAYGAWQPKKMFGKEFFGVKRMTVIIDPGGKVAHVFKSVKPEGHAEAVLKKLQTLKK